jgi:iron complex transport system substrate-binding protein
MASPAVATSMSRVCVFWSMPRLARGRTRPSDVQMRVVSLACSNTEIVCALGCADRLVGVDDHSDFPAEVVARLPRVGPDLGVEPEKVRALAPDLVFASLTVPGHEKVVASLESAGLPVVVLAPRSIGDVLSDIRTIAAALGVPERGEALAGELSRRLEPLPPVRGARPKILIEWWPRPMIVPGRRSWATELIERAGGENPLGHEEVESRPLSDEEAAALEPDAIVVSWCGVPYDKYRPDVVRRRAAFAGSPVLEGDRVHCIAEAYLGRPGPRLVEGLAALREVVEACVPR